jgi:hypothetical protein
VRHATAGALIPWFALVLACGGGGGDGGTTGPNGSNNPGTRAPAASVSCGSTKAIFTVLPVKLTDFFGWVPLGNMNPPGHTFPTDHQYIYVNNPESSAPRREVDMVAPSDMYITKAHRGTTTPGITDYTLEFSPCAELYGQFGHVVTIEASILAGLGAFDQFCNTYSPVPTSTVSTCETKTVAIKVTAGQKIGTAGGVNVLNSFGLDFSLWDARRPSITYANPARWNSSSDKFDSFHIVAASDYFAEPAASQIAPRVGSFDGLHQRTIAPVGGSMENDVAGTAAGIWFNASQPTYPEYPHLALVPDNVDPSQISISAGTSLQNWARGLVRYTPGSSGLVNRNPSAITADGATYCFEAPGAWVLILKLLDANTLRVQGMPQTVATCAGAQPWTFTSAAFDYKR